MSPLEKVWTYREETLYPRLFGKMSRGIFPLTADIFEQVFDERNVDPRWLHLGVFEYAPHEGRQSWLYVTSGASTPWETEPKDYDADAYSWLGVELVLEAPEQAEWPILVLQRLLAYHVLLCYGRFGDNAPLDYGHRLPIGGTIDHSDNSPVRFMAMAKPDHYPATAQLESGKFEFLHVVGITEQERDYAKSTSTADLISLLQAAGAAPVTKPQRSSVPPRGTVP